MLRLFPGQGHQAGFLQHLSRGRRSIGRQRDLLFRKRIRLPGRQRYHAQILVVCKEGEDEHEAYARLFDEMAHVCQAGIVLHIVDQKRFSPVEKLLVRAAIVQQRKGDAYQVGAIA